MGSSISKRNINWFEKAERKALLHWVGDQDRFHNLVIVDRVALCQAGWNTLIIGGILSRSLEKPGPGLRMACRAKLRDSSHPALPNDVKPIFDRILTSIVPQMHKLKLSPKEIGYLMMTELFNPAVPDLEMHDEVVRYRMQLGLVIQGESLLWSLNNDGVEEQDGFGFGGSRAMAIDVFWHDVKNLVEDCPRYLFYSSAYPIEKYLAEHLIEYDRDTDDEF